MIRGLRAGAEDAAATLLALMADAQKIASGPFPGGHRLRRAGGMERFWQFRPYRAGDRPQDIDWRQSAKSDSIYTREREREEASPILFWRAGGAGMDFSSSPQIPTKGYAAALLTLALAILADNGGEAIGPLAGTRRAGSGEAALNALGHELLAPASSLPAVGNRAIPAHAFIILAGDFLEPAGDIASALTPLTEGRRKGCIIQTLDPAEIDFPFTGRVRFEGMNGQQDLRHTVNAAESIQTAYRERMAGHQESIRAVCREAGWSHHFHRTNSDPRATLEAVVAEAGR